MKKHLEFMIGFLGKNLLIADWIGWKTRIVKKGLKEYIDQYNFRYS